jgi:hypothetical protein
MNERIKVLADQCWSHRVDGRLVDGQLHFDQQKFAELIVKECMNVLDPGEHQLIARFQARKWLAEHFGVKE